MAEKPLGQLLKQTDPEGCHITNLPSRIWVLGGFCNVRTDGPALSYRDAFWRTSIAAGNGEPWFVDLIRPEELPGWLEHSGYTNLLEFERDACHLARAIILFAESPGSLAELGAIAIDDSLVKRLAVIVQYKYRVVEKMNSFLNLGPIRRAAAEGRLCVIGADQEFVLLQHDYDDIVAAIGPWIPIPHKREKVYAGNLTHRFLLVADLCDILLVASEPDLVDALAHFGVASSVEELRRALGLLGFLGLVTRQEAGKETYWVRGEDRGPWIDYKSSSKDSPFDRARFKIRAAGLINSIPRLKSIYERKLK